MQVTDPELEDMLGGAHFSSVTYRLFKLPEGLLDEKSEDYGQAARYLVRVQQEAGVVAVALPDLPLPACSGCSWGCCGASCCHTAANPHSTG